MKQIIDTHEKFTFIISWLHTSGLQNKAILLPSIRIGWPGWRKSFKLHRLPWCRSSVIYMAGVCLMVSTWSCLASKQIGTKKKNIVWFLNTTETEVVPPISKMNFQAMGFWWCVETFLRLQREIDAKLDQSRSCSLTFFRAKNILLAFDPAWLGCTHAPALQVPSAQWEAACSEVSESQRQGKGSA